MQVENHDELEEYEDVLIVLEYKGILQNKETIHKFKLDTIVVKAMFKCLILKINWSLDDIARTQ